MIVLKNRIPDQPSFSFVTFCSKPLVFAFFCPINGEAEQVGARPVGPKTERWDDRAKGPISDQPLFSFVTFCSKLLCLCFLLF